MSMCHANLCCAGPAHVAAGRSDADSVAARSGENPACSPEAALAEWLEKNEDAGPEREMMGASIDTQSRLYRHVMSYMKGSTECTSRHRFADGGLYSKFMSDGHVKDISEVQWPPNLRTGSDSWWPPGPK